MSDLKDKYISDSYHSILHTPSDLGFSSTQVTIEDGDGVSSALSLGPAGEGATINGILTVDGNGVFNQDVVIVGSANITTNLTVEGSITGGLTITGGTTFDGGTVIDSSGNVTIGGTINVAGLATVGDLRIGDVDYPSSASGASGKVLMVNSSLDVVFSDIGSVSSDDSNTITQTQFVQFPTGGNETTDITLPSVGDSNDWKTLTFDNTLNGWKGAIIYVAPRDTILSEDTRYLVDVSPDRSRVFPVLYMGAGEGAASDDSEPYGSGGQFHCPVGSNGRIYVRARDGSRNDDGNVILRFNLIAKLK